MRMSWLDEPEEPIDLQAMAWTRGQYKDEIEDDLMGGLLHFYKIQVAKKNGQTRSVRHWESELKGFLDTRMFKHLRHPTTFKGKWLALDEASDIVRKDDAKFRDQAEYIARDEYGAENVPLGLDAGDMMAFWILIEEKGKRALGERPVYQKPSARSLREERKSRLAKLARRRR